jgi:hypothetical protein
MSLDRPTNQFNGELAALQSRREMESLSTSLVSSALSEIADVVDQFGVPGAGLFAKALKSGQTPVEKVVEQLENGAYAEIVRIREQLEGQDTRLKEFDMRLKSQEAQAACVAAVLHGLRTSDPKKHFRLGGLTINCVYANDLAPESLDDMMRAAAELKDADISMLGKLYQLWKPLLQGVERAKHSISWSPNFHNEIQNVWRNFGRSLNPPEQLEYRGSFARLQSHGMIQQVTFSNNEVGREPYVLLEDGAKFYERLQEVSV